MVLDDDDDEKWEDYPGHTKAKHELVDYYLPAWIKKLGSEKGKLRLFDCFAGRGEYYPEDDQKPFPITHIETPAEYPGSPQILLDLAVEYADNVGQFECIYIEKEEENAEILDSNLPKQSSLPSNVSYKIVPGKFQNKTVEAIRDTGGWNIPSFFLLDPFGYSPLKYDLVTKIASTSRFEVLINLMASEVHRWQDVEKHQENHQDLFGCENWHRELEEFEPEHWNDKEVAYYCHRLEQNGPEHTISYLVTREDSKAMVYYLVFCTNHEDGLEIMRSGMKNCGPGEFAYAPNRPEISKQQKSLGAVTKQQEEKKIRDRLVANFSGEEITFDDIIGNLVTDDKYWPYERKHVRSVLKDMESNDEIKIIRVTSKTDRGLGGQDIILFSATE